MACTRQPNRLLFSLILQHKYLGKVQETVVFSKVIVMNLAEYSVLGGISNNLRRPF